MFRETIPYLTRARAFWRSFVCALPILLFFCIGSPSLQAADRYWVAKGSTGTWNNTANWSTSSGGGSGASVPLASDQAIFDGKGLVPCILDVTVSVSSMTISTSTTGGFTGYVDSSSQTLTVSQNFTMNRGAFYARTSSITVGSNWAVNSTANFQAAASTVSFTATAVGKTVQSGGSPFNNVQFNGVGGFWTMQDSMTVASTMMISSGTLDSSAANCAGVTCNLSVGGGFLVVGGVFSTRQSTVTFTGAVTGLQIRSSGKANFGKVIFTGSGGYYSLADSMTVTTAQVGTGASLDLNSFNLAVASFTNLGNVVLQGKEIVTGGAPLGVSGSTVTYDGTAGTNIIFSTWTYRNLIINGGSTIVFNAKAGIVATEQLSVLSGTFTTTAAGSFPIAVGSDVTLGNSASFILNNATMTVGGSWTNSGANFVTGRSTVTFNSAALDNTLQSGTDAFNNIQFTGGGYWTLIDSMTVASTMTITQGTLDTSGTNCAGTGCNIAVTGSWYNIGGTFIANSSTVTFNGITTGQKIKTNNKAFDNLAISGTGFWTMMDSATLTSTMTLTAGTLDASATNCSGAVCNLSVGGGWLNSGGFFSIRQSTVTFTGAVPGLRIKSSGKSNFGKAVFTGSGGYYSLSDSMTVTTAQVGTGVSLDLNSFNLAVASFTNLGNVALQGREIVTGGAPLGVSGSTVTYDGTAGTNIIFSTWTYRNLIINGGSTIVFNAKAGIVATEQLSVLSGTFTTTAAGSFPVAVGSDVTLGNSASFILNNATMTVGGDWDNSGANFVAGGSTIAFKAAIAQSIDNAGQAFWVIIDSNTSGGGVTFASSFTANALRINGAGLASATTVYFNAGSTYTITALSLNGGGSATTRVTLRSTNDGTTWNLNNAVSSASWINVKDSDADLGNTIIATNAADFLNNSNWNFSGAGILRTWTGGADTDWSNSANWDTRPPFSQDSALISNGVAYLPTLTAAVTISTLTLQSGSSVTANGFNLSLASFTNAGNFVFAGTETVNTIPNNLAGSSVTYNAAAGTSIVLSSWTYRNLLISGGAGALFNAKGGVVVKESLTITSGTFNTTAAGNFAIAVASHVVINGNNATLTLNASSMTVGGDWTKMAGVFNSNTSTVTFTATTTGRTIQSGESPFNNAQFNGSGGYWTLADPLTATSTMTISAGTLDTSGGSSAISVGGSWVNSGGTFVANQSSVTFTGANTGQKIIPKTSPFYILAVSGSGGWQTQTNPVTVSSGVVINAGTLSVVAGSSLTVGADIDLNAGGALAVNNDVAVNGGHLFVDGTLSSLSTATVQIVGNGVLGGAGAASLPRLTLSGAAATTTLLGNLTVKGFLTNSAGHTLDANAGGNYSITMSSDWLNSGTFAAQSGSVLFTTTATLTGSNTFYNLTSSVPGITLTLPANSTQTVQGTLSLLGLPTDRIKLVSSSPGTYAYLTLNGAQSVVGVSATDNNAGAGNEISDPSGSTSHTINWNACSALTSAGVGPANWSAPGSWTGGITPTLCNAVTVAAGHTITVDADVQSSTLTINGTLSFSRVQSSTLTLVGGNITVNGGGRLDMGTSGSPINGKSATLTLAYNPNPGQYGLLVNAGGSLLVYGDSSYTGLSKNVVVQSSGTTGTDVSSYIRSLATSVTSFSLNYGEFDYLGTGLPGDSAKFGISVTSRASISSCTINNGYYGIFFDSASYSNIVNNTISTNTVAIGLWSGSSNTVTGNVITKSGIELKGSSFTYIGQNTITNAVAGGGSYDSGIMMILGTGNTINANTITQGGFGNFALDINASSNTVSGNTLAGSGNAGGMSVAGQGNTISSNTVTSGQSPGISVTSPNNLIISNQVYGNSGGSPGILLAAANNTTLINNFTYAGASDGLQIKFSSNVVVTGDGLGFSPSGASTNSGYDFYNLSSTVTLKAVQLIPGRANIGKVTVSPNTLSYSQDTGSGIDAGSARIWGEYIVANSTFTLDYSTYSYLSSATYPKLMRGTGHSAQVVGLIDGNTVTQGITLTFAGGTNWTVTGSVAGDMGTIASGSNQTIPTTGQPQAVVKITQGGSAQIADAIDFAIIADAGDAQTQKKLYFEFGDGTVNKGRARMTIAATGGFKMTGDLTTTSPSVMSWDSLNTGSTYYTFVDSGAFTVSYATITNTDEAGLWLSNALVSVSTVTFDAAGQGVGSTTSTYVTATGTLTGGATWYNVTFQSSAGRSYGFLRNVRNRTTSWVASGAVIGWYFKNWDGAQGGSAFEGEDAGNKLSWDGTAYSCSHQVTSVSGGGNWSSAATWTGGVVPNACSPVMITSPGTVTVDGDIQTSTLTINGTLSFSRSGTSSLTIAGGNGTINSGGTLDMGSSGSPITGQTATLVLAMGQTGGQYGLTVNGGGNFLVYGDSSYTGLSKNVVVRSSGTSTGTNTAYIRSLATSATAFSLSYGEFDYLGTGTGLDSTKYGISVASRASISSCTINSGYYGIFFDSASYSTIASNTISSHTAAGVGIWNGSSNTITGNLITQPNLGKGIEVVGSNSSYVGGNFINLALGGGISVSAGSTGNMLTGNTILSSGFSLGGISLASSSNTVSGNTLWKCGVGINITDAGNTVSSNTVTAATTGISLAAPNNLLISNRAYGAIASFTTGLSINLAHNSTLMDNFIYGNNFSFSDEVTVFNSSNIVIVGGGLGFSPAGASHSTRYDYSNSGSSVTLKQTQLGLAFTNHSMGTVAPITMSYSQNPGSGIDAGSTRLWGEYRVGNTFAIDYATYSYLSSASAPKLMRGSGHSARVVGLVDGNTVSQLITLTFAGGTNWTVTGSVDGPMGTIASGSDQSIPTAGPVEAILNITQGGSALIADQLDFALIADSRDANSQKKLYLESAVDNGGRAKITVAPTGGFKLMGDVTSNSPSIMSWDALNTASTYYTFVDSGAFTVAYGSITNVDELGLWLSNASVVVSTLDFDLAGQNVASTTSTYITAAGALTGGATWYNVSFGAGTGRTYPFLRNVRNRTTSWVAAGATSGWMFRPWSGPKGGAANEGEDAGGKINWGLSAPNNPAITAVFRSSMTVTWGTASPSSGYQIDASTASDFTGTLLSSATTFGTRTSLTFQPTLNPDTTYYVRAGNIASGATTFVTADPLPTSTLANPLLNILLYGVFGTSITVNWTAFGVSPGTNTSVGYELDASTVANFTGNIFMSSNSIPSGSTLTVTGLSPFTTYYMRAGAYNNDGVANFVNVNSTETVGLSPLAPTVAAVYLSSISVTWTAVSPSSGYKVEVSTASGFTGTIKSSTTTDGALTSLVVDSATSLSPDTTYYIRVGNLFGGTTSYTAIFSTSTLANRVLNVRVYGVFGTSITVNWTAFAVSPGTNTSVGYELDASTAADFTGQIFLSSNSIPAVSTLTVSGLAPATTYYLRAGAYNNTQVANFVNAGSTQTVGVPPLSSSVAAVSLSSISVIWTAASQSGGYEVEVSTANDFTGSLKSTATPDVNRTSLVVDSATSLSNDTTYYLRVGNVLSGTTSYSSTLSTPTLATPLTNLLISQVYTTSVTVNWPSFASGSGANTGEGYELNASTAVDFSGQVFMSSNTTPAVSTLTVSGLAVSTTYYFRAGAYNHSLRANFVTAGSTQTVSIAPLTVSVGAVFRSSVTVIWSTVGGSQGYLVEASTANNFTGTLKSSKTTDGAVNTLSVDGGATLSPDTTYYIRVGNLVGSATAYSPVTPSTATLASFLNPLLSVVNISSLTVNWTAFTNASGANTAPGGYQLDVSTVSSFVPLWTSSATTSVSASTLTVSGLTNPTTYYLRVAALNWNNVPNFVVMASTRTRGPDAVVNLAASALGTGDVRLTWSAPYDPYYQPLSAGSQYAIEWATYTVTYSTSNGADTGYPLTYHVYIATSGVNAGDSQVYVSTGLAGNVSYQFRLWTRDPFGAWSPISNSVSATVTPVLSITFSTHSYNFGSVNLGATTVSTQAVTITNGGNVTETYALSVDTTGASTEWSVTTGSPTGFNTFVFYGAFNSVQISSSSFVSNDVIRKTPTTATGSVYSKNETGYVIPAAVDRHLWLRLDMPLTTSTTVQQQMNLTVTATTP